MPSISRWSMGDIADGEPVLVRVHSECLTGDIFASLRCDCGPQLHAALRLVEEAAWASCCTCAGTRAAASD